MTLADLRRTSIRKNVRIRFQLPNGMECVVNEHGVAQVPALRAVPDFNLDALLRDVREFVIEPSTPDAKANSRPRHVTLDQLAALTSPPGAAPHEDHEE